MVDYKKLYHMMVDASEQALAAMARQNYGVARKTLIRAERTAEELYLETADDEPEGNGDGDNPEENGGAIEH